jgi:hypothetical protein
MIFSGEQHSMNPWLLRMTQRTCQRTEAKCAGIKWQLSGGVLPTCRKEEATYVTLGGFGRQFFLVALTTGAFLIAPAGKVSASALTTDSLFDGLVMDLSRSRRQLKSND